MDCDGKAEGRGQTRGDVLPAAPAIGRAPDPVMVLLIQKVRIARRPHHIVHAMAGLAVLRPCRMVDMPAGLCVGQAVAPLPACPAVFAGKDPRRRDPQPDFVGIRRAGHDRVQRQPHRTRRPAVRRGVIRQAFDRGPACARILADKQRRGLGTGVELAAHLAQRPDRLDPAGKLCWRLWLGSEKGRRIRVIADPFVDSAVRQLDQIPAFAAIRGPPDPCARPFATPAGPERSCFRIADGVVDSPTIAERSLDRPVRPRRIRLQQEQALAGAHQHRDRLCHDTPS